MRRPGLHGGFWPRQTQRALLGVTLGALEPGVARWRDLQPIDVTALEPGSFCLLPLLHERLSEASEDDPQASLLLGTYRSTWYRNQLLLERLSALVPELLSQDAEPIVVGGAALAPRWYARLGSRPIGQLELVVDPTAGPQVRKAALACGWRSAGRSRTFSRFVDAAGMSLVVHEGAPPPLAGPLGREHGYVALREAAGPRDLGDVRVLGLQPADELLYCVALGARTTTVPTVQWLVDAVQILTSPDRPEPTLVVARARMFHVIEPLRETLRYLVKAIDVRSLDDYISVLEPERVSARDRLAYRLGGARVGVFGGLPLTLSAHLRATAEDSPWHVVTKLPRHLQQAWETETLREIPDAAWKRASRIVRRRPYRRAQAAGGKASERNCSASS